jgi:hypothetical protein
MGNILEHVDSPGLVVENAVSWLTRNGVILATVPNADSFHRLLGVEMGLIDEVSSLNDTDKKIGHQRVFNMRSFKSLFRHRELDIRYAGGIFIKILSYAQMENYSDELMKGLWRMGDYFPDNCANLFIVAEKVWG